MSQVSTQLFKKKDWFSILWSICIDSHVKRWEYTCVANTWSVATLSTQCSSLAECQNCSPFRSMQIRTSWPDGTAHTRSAWDNLPFHLRICVLLQAPRRECILTQIESKSCRASPPWWWACSLGRWWRVPWRIYLQTAWWYETSLQCQKWDKRQESRG